MMMSTILYIIILILQLQTFNTLIVTVFLPVTLLFLNILMTLSISSSTLEGFSSSFISFLGIYSVSVLFLYFYFSSSFSSSLSTSLKIFFPHSLLPTHIVFFVRLFSSFGSLFYCFRQLISIVFSWHLQLLSLKYNTITINTFFQKVERCPWCYRAGTTRLLRALDSIRLLSAKTPHHQLLTHRNCRLALLRCVGMA